MVPGTVTAPPCSFVLEQEFSEDCRYARIRVDAAASLRGSSALLVTMASGSYRITVNGEEMPCQTYDHALAVPIRDGEISEILVTPR